MPRRNDYRLALLVPTLSRLDAASALHRMLALVLGRVSVRWLGSVLPGVLLEGLSRQERMVTGKRTDSYSSHRWKRERQMTDYGAGYEYIVVCDDCGCENRGDPFEFPELEYLYCPTEKDASL